jgi:hypothetical protein
MINLTQTAFNDNIYIYVDTTSVDIPFENPSFLFGFKNSFTNHWVYVVPTIITQNSRYTVFGVNSTNPDIEDPLDAKVALSPAGNWTYKLWATDTPTLDPQLGYLLDEGQMQLDACKDETLTVSYVSDNDSAQSTVYLTRDCSQCLVWSTVPDNWNLLVAKWNECN